MATKPTINQWAGNPGRHNLSKRGGASNIKYVCVHYTAGTGSARNNCVYFSGGNRNASADFFIDPDGTTWQFSPDLGAYYTWAVGDGGGKYGITNKNSVSIEFVNTGGAFTGAQIKAGAKLVQWLMAAYGVPAANVKRHYDASRKSCPAHYVDPARWAALHKQLTTGAVTSTTAAQTTTTATAGASTASGSKLGVDGHFGPATVKALQKALGTVADGHVSNQPSANAKHVGSAVTSAWGWRQSGYAGGSPMVKAVQKWAGCASDGYWGKDTSKAVQKRLVALGYSVGADGADGYFGANSCKALQRALNDGKVK